MMRCKFDPSHGEFVNPNALAVHYSREHPEYEPEPKVRRRCTLCGEVRAYGSIPGHMRNQHGIEEHPYTLTESPDDPISLPEPETYRLVKKFYECLVCHREFSTNNIGGHLAKSHKIADWRPHVRDIGKREVTITRKPRKEVGRLEHLPHLNGSAPEIHEWTVDDIVVPVMTQLAEPSGMIPVAHLVAILAWRDATSALLSAISRE